MSKKMRMYGSLCAALFLFLSTMHAQFVHPGLSHKQSDLHRMRDMIEAKVDPWYTSYQEFCADPKASFDYVVQGDPSLTVVYRDAPRTNKNKWVDDSRAAYYNALRWCIEGDERHAQKAVEIFNAWTGLTYVQAGGTEALSGSMIYVMVEAAELIKSTYDGWLEEDIQKFKDMLVYPGYSTTEVPTDLRTQGTWYWRCYKFDRARAGNQELSAIRAVMAMGVFLDNEIMYDRALRYVSGLPARADDLPYPPGPNIQGDVIEETEYRISYSMTEDDSIPDYGFNGVMTHYIWENGQCEESSRDQGHTIYGIGLLCSLGEMAWNQGDDLWGHADSRTLLGLEYTLRYNVSYLQSYPDQASPWEPTVESGEFIQRVDRTARTKSLKINPYLASDYTRITRGQFYNQNTFELPLAHYVGRGFKSTDSDAKWLARARDYSYEVDGQYEGPSTDNGYLGWGALTFRRPELCYGDPISGFNEEGLPIFSMHSLPATIEAENFDYSPVSGEGRIYHDTTVGNSGGAYRTDESVDIEALPDGGNAVVSMEAGEYLVYTVSVPGNAAYNLSARVSGLAAGGTLSVSFGGVDLAGPIEVPATGGSQNWVDLELASNVSLTQGVQAMTITVGGASNVVNLDSVTVDLVSKLDQSIAFPALPIVELGEPAVYLEAQASSGLAVRYANSNEEVATVSGRTLHAVGEGVATITASQAGSVVYNAARDVSRVFQVNPRGSSVKVEAESYVAQSGTRTELTEDDGSLNLGYIEEGDYMEYEVEVPLAGTYVLQYRVASRDNGAALSVTRDGVVIDSLASLPTGGWQFFETVGSKTPVEFSAGTHTIRITAEGSGWNINWFRLALVEPLGGNPPEKSFQFIEFDALEPAIVSDPDIDLAVTASSGLPVDIESSNPSVAVVSGGVVQIVGEGTTLLTASQAGNGSYYPASDFIRALVVRPEPSLKFEAEDFSSQLGVSVENTTDFGGGRNVGRIDAGDYMEYSVSIPRSGQYLLAYRVASRDNGGSFDLKLNDEVVDGLSFAPTGGWQDWETVHSGNYLPIEAGDYTVRIEVDGSGWNFNWFQFLYAGAIGAPSPSKIKQTIEFSGFPELQVGDFDYPIEAVATSGLEISYLSSDPSVASVLDGKLQLNGVGTATITASQAGDSFFAAASEVSRVVVVTPVPVTVLVEGEDWVNQSGLRTETTRDVGGGLNVAYIDTGDFAEYSVEFPVSGLYSLEYRVAGRSSGALALSVDGDLLDEVSFPSTGNWQNWETVSSGETVFLSKGGRYMRLDIAKGGWNLNWFRFVLEEGDTDEDGVLDGSDAFPEDPSEWADSDGDGIGNNADLDDDNDGVADSEDAFPLDPTESEDLDGDGIGNNADLDDDGDGIEDEWDNCPTIPNTNQVDLNGDGYGDLCVAADVNIDSSVVILYAPLIGSGVSIHKDVVIGDHVNIGAGVEIHKDVIIGNDFAVGENSKIKKTVSIGNDVFVGDGVDIDKDTVIEDEVVIGDNATIKKNVLIGAGSYIGRGVMIEKDTVIPPGSYYPDAE
ncbi:carbohydrate-binding protein [Pelagicoccus sp. SDUM812005]|uniref:carbohydrate-binding protein n=1 Tax=Pelagicoccus sp. SDUM812005 TaxID=3041257 RepID=UPI00280C9BE5|nr:carbohydrate-binding protein [Pelagicoccus sp. SDUM812005]MDQ8183458.1 carbohydrate-binding protein [Pelagicoccus sp. SDUM812005]